MNESILHPGGYSRVSRTPHPTSLRRARMVAQLRQSDVAAAAGVCRDTLRRLEAGTQRPQFATAVRIAAALGHDDPRVLFPELLDG